MNKLFEKCIYIFSADIMQKAKNMAGKDILLLPHRACHMVAIRAERLIQIKFEH